ncbi:hypothetical protein F5Y09DRAFT_117278 [Xylaria sp. FL1042]|nr:hypothetical protein F5Y09DRAFT_117278 [Xylaria sp. FL1042]
MKEMPCHAIVFGASGLIGWAVVNQLLRCYPEAGTFSKITAVTNRPVSFFESYWPGLGADRPKLHLISGIDLSSANGDTLASSLREAVEDIETVTHLYYLAFTSASDDIDEVATNRRMLQNVIDAHNFLSPGLQFVVFPGGTRGYGIYSASGVFTPPLTEDMANSLPPGHAKTVVYPAYRELLSEASEGRNWTWCEVCPDAIIGFTPNGSQFSLALHWAQYLSLYAHNHGVGPTGQQTRISTIEVPFPGSTAGADSLFSPVSAAKIARFMIYASLHPDTCGRGQLFNIADTAVPCTYGELWPRLANWFGLVGGQPVGDSDTKTNSLAVGEVPEGTQHLTPGGYIAKHRAVFAKHGRNKAVHGGVGTGSSQLDSVGFWLTFDRQLSIEKLNKIGFEESIDPVQGWIDSFEMFRRAGLIL